MSLLKHYTEIEEMPLESIKRLPISLKMANYAARLAFFYYLISNEVNKIKTFEA